MKVCLELVKDILSHHEMLIPFSVETFWSGMHVGSGQPRIRALRNVRISPASQETLQITWLQQSLNHQVIERSWKFPQSQSSNADGHKIDSEKSSLNLSFEDYCII